MLSTCVFTGGRLSLLLGLCIIVCTACFQAAAPQPPTYFTTLYAGKLYINNGTGWGENVWTGYRARNGEVILIERETNPPTMTFLSPDSKVIDSFEVGGTVEQIYDLILSDDGQIIVYSGPCELADCPAPLGTVIRDRTTKHLIAFYETSLHPTQWTRDGRLLLARAYGDEGMFLTAVGGVEPLQQIIMTDPIMPRNPRINAAGDLIAFEWQKHVWMANFDSSTLTVTWPKQVSQEKGDGEYSNPAWAPNGRRIVMVYHKEGYKAGILYQTWLNKHKEPTESEPIYGEFDVPISSDFGPGKPIITWTL